MIEHDIQAQKNYISTFSGLTVFPKDPDPSTITIIDIAHHLSMDCRFSGATRDFYSVAQHSVLASMLIERFFGKGDLVGVKGALLHDATEAYLRDMPAGVKQLPELDGYRSLETPLAACIFGKFGLEPRLVAEVKLIDKRLAATEAVCLLGKLPEWVGTGDYQPIPGLEIFPMNNRAAETAFLDRFAHLFGHEALNG